MDLWRQMFRAAVHQSWKASKPKDQVRMHARTHARTRARTHARTHTGAVNQEARDAAIVMAYVVMAYVVMA